MKNLYFLLFALGATLTLSAQISNYPYTESFDANSQCTGWTVTTGTWFHNTTTGTIEVDNHSQTNVHAYLFSPWLNTNSLNHPIIQFDLRINADNPSSCVPQLDLGYTDSTFSGAVNVIQFNIASNNQCTGTSATGYLIPNNQWTTLSFPLPWYNHIQLEFNSVFPGTGTLEVRNAYIGERLSTGIESLQPRDISVYPNPASDNLTVNVDGIQTDIVFSITDMLGETVLSNEAFILSDSHTKTCSVANLQGGIYILHTSANGLTAAQKISVTH